ncbi:bifunctional 5,10-methylenetetrahydrofolate dehydrogenase/5,10-methenyltetrahydrofolate cyclohydrolase [Salinibacillus xinjiangensis]|uniref:Bifunctional protein FolD n=1 Tax=Salinibacillus xinjiangensis TaxID=1229268 RepID=A0A6G1XB05_9BACI|nr:tetrahydrofolate dehydrogenase/cyclohydrolase catalytic domain-containing protein [Salinibacillus xinjiangensis]MRG88060.1 bifunctional 5,10-methylene-tetrahydrofolate dehydrogenase/5,10-methylene-tetrahydrofolate cyclohydrolase [Salinibacillus xinjiangensis]
MEKQIILDGKHVAKEVKDSLKHRVEALKEQDITPCLATILVGNDPSSETYVKMKGNACGRLGIRSMQIHLPEETTTDQLLDQIIALNEDESVHGILLQHPVPRHIDERLAFDTISIEKDVDGVTTEGFGQTAFHFGRFPSCTPAAIMEIINFYNLEVEGKHAVVIGRSPILGKPVSMMLLNRNATVTVCHSKTENLPQIVQQADVIVAAVGMPKFVKGDWVKEGAVILDAGYNKGNIGDVDYDSCVTKASAITPVPGGVGPVTISMLLKHTVLSAEMKS